MRQYNCMMPPGKWATVLVADLTKHELLSCYTKMVAIFSRSVQTVLGHPKSVDGWHSKQTTMGEKMPGSTTINTIQVIVQDNNVHL